MRFLISIQALSQEFQKEGYMGAWCICMHARLGGVWGHAPQESFRN